MMNKKVQFLGASLNTVWRSTTSVLGGDVHLAVKTACFGKKQERFIPFC